MGEQLNGGGPAARRHAHPDGPTPDLEALLAAAMRPADVDADGERRALDAFRAAREAGAHRARTRRRDDWRPRTRRRTARSLRATLSLFAASLTLGGVAFAAIGTTGSSSDTSDDRGRPTPTPSVDDTPSAAATAPHDRPATAKDTEAKCRAYDKVAGNGSALESTAWQRLIEAAGGEDKVAAYCAQRLAPADKGKGTGESKSGTGESNNSGTGKTKGKADKKN
ncbi:hypothetical protein OHT76_26885 [Streptomyces sp. NBC_00287]|uniref:hypothetical protein n=1 Tax=Streptomyces sp. NBC_00287 TaxID=2975702 RepID=UPI002E27D551|nr:hypothetical protein [Streptomyces sp. NBC_00287]